jgi:hypothetical protein
MPPAAGDPGPPSAPDDDDLPEPWAYPFLEGRYTVPADLGEAFSANWFDASSELRDPHRIMMLRDWIRQFDGPRGYDVVSRDVMLDVVDGDDPVNVRLVEVVRWLTPHGAAVYAGASLNAETLWNLSARAVTPGVPARIQALDLCAEVVDYRVLQILASASDGEELGRIEARRTQAVERWDQASREVVASYPDLAVRLEEHDALPAELLNIAVDEPRAARRLGRLLAAGRRRFLARGVPRWFTFLLESAGTDAVRMLAVLRCLPEAAEQTNRRIDGDPAQPDPVAPALQPAAQAAAPIQGGEHPYDPRYYPPPAANAPPPPPAFAPEPVGPQRVGHALAVFFAMVGIAAGLVLWLLYLGLLVPPVQRAKVGVVVALVLLAQAAAECWLAYTLGRDYHPRYALLQRVVDFFERAFAVLFRQADTLTRGGMVRAILVIVGMIFVLSALTSLTSSFCIAVPLAVLIGHIGWAYMRWVRWTIEHGAPNQNP